MICWTEFRSIQRNDSTNVITKLAADNYFLESVNLRIENLKEIYIKNLMWSKTTLNLKRGIIRILKLFFGITYIILVGSEVSRKFQHKFIQKLRSSTFLDSSPSASWRPHWNPQTVPHWPLCFTSTRPI